MFVLLASPGLPSLSSSDAKGGLRAILMERGILRACACILRLTKFKIEAVGPGAWMAAILEDVGDEAGAGKRKSSCKATTSF